MDCGRRSKMWIICLTQMLTVQGVVPFSLLGHPPRDYKKGDPIMVRMESLTSTKTQLPYSYYSVPFCRPESMVEPTEQPVENLGSDGEISPYKFNMLEPLTCKVVCRMTVDAKSAKAFAEKIEDEYRVNMFLDELPAVQHLDHELVSYRKGTVFYCGGYDIGFIGQYVGSNVYTYYVNNHLVFTVKYSYSKEEETDSIRIVGFEVKPDSVKHDYVGEWGKNVNITTCHSGTSEEYFSGPQKIRDKEDIIFTYDVVFEESSVKWESRWDNYLRMLGNDQGWYAVINSLATLLFLLGVMAIVVMRTYHDISGYEEPDKQAEETGWKVLHGDVFRPPNNSDLLCICAGSGIQCLGAMVATLMCALSGLISPSNWSEILSSILSFWVLMGYFAGYTSARLYRLFEGTHWKKLAFKTAFMFPGLVAVCVVILNAVMFDQKSASAITPLTMFVLVFFCFTISTPLIFTGSYFGYKKQVMEIPVRPSKIPREVPHQIWWKKPLFSSLLGGMLPFVGIFYDLFHLLLSLWLHQFYAIRIFQFYAFVSLLVASAGTSVLLCYLQLCREDYRWWWMSYLTPGFSGVYLFLYGAYFFAGHLYITKPVSMIIYFGYMFIGSLAFFLLTGTAGFFGCFLFVKFIYSSLKID